MIIRKLRIGAVVLVVILSGISMLNLRFSYVELSLFSGLRNSGFSHEASYQLLTLGLAALVIALSRLLAGAGSFEYLIPSRLSGHVTPEPLVGIRAGKDDDWKALGLNFLIVISVVTAIAIYLQIINSGGFVFSIGAVLLPAILFAFVNSFTEEVIFRFSIVSVFLGNGAAARIAALSSGLLFGAVHYWGSPGGIPGVFLAGFLGWLLAKSIAETRSLAWAWIIHFAQDVIIFTAIFGTAQ